LALFVARVFADDAHDSFAAHDAAGFAELLDGRADFHGDGEWRKIEEVGTRALQRISPVERKQIQQRRTKPGAEGQDS
jgi:hypothetical protein